MSEPPPPGELLILCTPAGPRPLPGLQTSEEFYEGAGVPLGANEATPKRQTLCPQRTVILHRASLSPSLWGWAHRGALSCACSASLSSFKCCQLAENGDILGSPADLKLFLKHTAESGQRWKAQRQLNKNIRVCLSGQHVPARFPFKTKRGRAKLSQQLAG